MHNKDYYIKLLHNFALTTIELPYKYIYDNDINQLILKHKWYILNSIESEWIVLIKYITQYD